MHTHDTDTLRGTRCIALSGDDHLIRELSSLLEANGYTVLPAHDAEAIAAAGADVRIGLDVSLGDAAEKQERVRVLDDRLPASALIISSSVTVTAAQQALWMHHPERLIGYSAFPTLLAGPLAEVAITARTTDTAVEQAREFFAALGKEMVSVQDRTGMIVPGLLAQIINEALMAVQENVASPQDVDAAMKAGAGYPLGPIEWGEKIGFAHIARVLDAMRADSGEDRYRVSSLLRQLSMSGKFWVEKIPVAAPVQEVLQLDDVPVSPDAAGTTAAAAAPKKRREKKSR